MKLLIPSQLFLRVKEKNYAHFAHKDHDLGRDELAVYLRIFSLAIDTGYISLPQKELADDCRISVRQLQHALHFLEDHEYLSIGRNPGSWCTYSLLLSDHIMALLKKYDLIDNPQWYARQKSSSGKRVQPPHPVQGGCAQSAHPSYKDNKKDKNQNTLQTSPPVISKVTPPDAPGGESFSSAAAEDFEALWASWPVKQDKASASKAFASLQRGRKLPDMQTLLAVVEKFRTSDRRWLNGFAPNLSNWLRGARWNDEVITAADKANASEENKHSLSSTPAVLPVMPEVPTKPLAELPSDLVAAAEELCQIWPDQPSRSPVKALFRARFASVNAEVMLRNARAYLRDCKKPAGLLRWLRESLGELHEKNETAGVCQGRIPCEQGRSLCAA